MDKLLVDVSQTALAAGIDVQLFEPLVESFQDFYAERPISIRMLGDYHEFGEFVSGVAALPRVVILTMHDISLKRAAAGQSRYGEQDEAEGNDKLQSPARGQSGRTVRSFIHPVALGECGLDFRPQHADKKSQLYYFEAHKLHYQKKEYHNL